MRNLNLKSKAFNKGEVLTRAQLKKVIGGDGSGVGDCSAVCNSCPEGYSFKPGYTKYTITVICGSHETCTAKDDDKVTCGSDKYTCEGEASTYCKKD